MKRCWIGFAMLVALLAGGLGVTWGMDHYQKPISLHLEAAAEAALTEDWEQTYALTDRAKADWERKWHFSAAFADHEPMEEIDALFAQLEVYKQAGDGISVAAVCSQLARQVEAMGDAHGLTWWNLL